MDKIRVLGIPSDLFGVGHYRIIWPLVALQKYCSDEFDVELRPPGYMINNDDVNNFDIIHFHRRLNEQENTINWVKKISGAGKIAVLDIDDFWTPFCGHPVELIAKIHKLDDMIKYCIRRTPFITTTTEIYAHMIRQLNKSVYVMVNALDTKQPQWRNNQISNDKIRIGWIGGSSHERDLKLLDGVFHMLFDDEELKGKFEVVMCGYDTRGSVTEIDPQTKQQKVRPIRPEESIWLKFEDIFSGGKGLSNPYYIRRNTLPITRYGQHYNYVDVCLAPIDRNMFNKAKSELKMVETGMMRKVLIASDLYVYHELLKNGENSILISPSGNKNDWCNAIKSVILSSELRLKLSSNLYTLVKDKYELANAVLERAKLYKMFVEESRNRDGSNKGSSPVSVIR